MSSLEDVDRVVGNVARGSRKRRNVEQRRRIVEETLVPGASVAAVARTHGINANLLFAWRRLYRAGQFGPTTANKSAPLLPVRISDESKRSVTAVVSGSAFGAGAIHIQFPDIQLRLEGQVDQATLRLVLEWLRR